MDLNITNLDSFTKFKNNFNKPNANFLDYLEFFGTESLAVSFAHLFYPELIEIGDSVLLKERFLQLKSLQKNNYSKSEFEKIINHLNVYDLFVNSNEIPNQEIDEYLGDIIIKFWRLSLKERYPDKIFEFIKRTEKDGDYGTSITFYEKHDN